MTTKPTLQKIFKGIYTQIRKINATIRMQKKTNFTSIIVKQMKIMKEELQK
jgi:hypothetical protein